MSRPKDYIISTPISKPFVRKFDNDRDARKYAEEYSKRIRANTTLLKKVVSIEYKI